MRKISPNRGNMSRQFTAQFIQVFKGSHISLPIPNILILFTNLQINTALILKRPNTEMIKKSCYWQKAGVKVSQSSPKHAVARYIGLVVNR